MVQRVMEGKITEAELRGLGLRVETIYKAADTITQMYADFYDAINDFLVAHGYEEIGWQRNYAPHQQVENLTKLQKYLQRLGFSVEVTELPTEIARTSNMMPWAAWRATSTICPTCSTTPTTSRSSADSMRGCGASTPRGS